MSTDCYDDTLNIITDDIRKVNTNNHTAISPEDRFAIALRNLQSLLQLLRSNMNHWVKSALGNELTNVWRECCGSGVNVVCKVTEYTVD